MNYLYLTIAIVSEVIATSALKAASGFTRLGPSLLVVVGYASAFYFLSLTLRTIPLGVAYAIWSGVGVALVTAVAWFSTGSGWTCRRSSDWRSSSPACWSSTSSPRVQLTEQRRRTGVTPVVGIFRESSSRLIPLTGGSCFFGKRGMEDGDRRDACPTPLSFAPVRIATY